MHTGRWRARRQTGEVVAPGGGAAEGSIRKKGLRNPWTEMTPGMDCAQKESRNQMPRTEKMKTRQRVHGCHRNVQRPRAERQEPSPSSFSFIPCSGRLEEPTRLLALRALTQVISMAAHSRVNRKEWLGTAVGRLRRDLVVGWLPCDGSLTTQAGRAGGRPLRQTGLEARRPASEVQKELPETWFLGIWINPYWGIW